MFKLFLCVDRVHGANTYKDAELAFLCSIGQTKQPTFILFYFMWHQIYMIFFIDE